MKSDTSFDSEAESIDSDKEIKEQKEDEKNLVNLDIIKSINDSLSTVLEENKKLSNYKEILLKQSKICFSSNSIPSITLYDYLIRIQKYANPEKNTLILSLIYIDRLCKLGNIVLTYYNIHRILFSAILLAIKYNEDEFFENNYYADIAGIKVLELKFIEYNFFCICEFNLYVNDDTFISYSRFLNKSDNNKERTKIS